MSLNNTIPVPTLSTLGWVRTVAEKIDFLLAHFFYSDQFQTTLYGNNVSNFQAILEQYGNDVTGAANAVRDTLTRYLGRYYQSVNVNTSTSLEDASKSSSRMVMVLSIFFTENGVEYNAATEVTSIDGRFKEFTRINNLQSAS